MSAGVGLRRPRGRGEDGQLAARLAAVALLAVLVQNGFFSELTIVGGRIDVLPLVALACGFLAGPLGGACAGFGMGLLSDLLLGTPAGLSSLLLLAIGDVGGRIGKTRDPEGLVVPVVTGATVTFASLVGTGILQVLLGAPSVLSWDLLRGILSTSLLGGLLAPFVYRATRFGLAGALARDPRARRRRATTTRLSPLSTSRGQGTQRGRSVSGGRLSRPLQGASRRSRPRPRVGGRR